MTSHPGHSCLIVQNLRERGRDHNALQHDQRIEPGAFDKVCFALYVMTEGHTRLDCRHLMILLVKKSVLKPILRVIHRQSASIWS